MTNKDLNLALDQSFIQPKPLSERGPTHPEPQINPAPTSPQNGQDPTTPHLGPVPTGWLSRKSPRHEWIIVTVVFANMLFLTLAGFWLSAQENQPSEIKVTKTAPSRDPLKITLSKLDTKLLSLDQKLNQLQLTLNEQQRLIATSSLNLDKQVQGLSLQLKNTAETAPKKSTPPTKAWHVNLGTFSTKEAALRLQQQILALGHQVKINNTSLDDKTAYRVQLPGFKDRESAELIARQIMDKTNLNGLWAWKDD